MVRLTNNQERSKASDLSGRHAAAALCAAWLLAACAQQSAAKPSDHPAPAQATTGSSVPAAEASDEPAPECVETAAEADPPAVAEAHAPVRIEDFMQNHFLIITWARDSVINGSLEALREPLNTLADFDYGSVTPGGWMPRIAALQATARITANADSLIVAAAGVATMARQCGDCHHAERHRPYFGPDIRAIQPMEAGSLRERMERHIWATDRMWEGLTAPSEEAWNAGAAALAKMPLDHAAVQVPVEYVPPLRALRELGAAALEAETRADRADLFGALLASCAGCHAHEHDQAFR